MTAKPQRTKQSPRTKSGLLLAEANIAKLAMAYPEVVEEHPWGHRAFKVRGKTFLFLGADAAELSFSVKLPASGEAVLNLPFAEPTHYGLGKSGWVTLSFVAKDNVPLALVEEWLSESYRAIAPKRLVAGLSQGSAAVAPKSTKPRPSKPRPTKAPESKARQALPKKSKLPEN